MRPVIQKAIEKEIRNQFERLDNFAWGIQQDVNRSVKAARDDPEQAQSIYQNYVNAFQKKMTAKKEAAKEKVSNTQVNLAVTKQDSIFKNISLPGGISTKATEFKELAAKGDKWESPVFGIGSAKESTNIPKLAEVSRKPHNAARGGVRGGNHPNSGLTGSNGSSNPISNSGAYDKNSAVNGSSGFGNQVDNAFDTNKSYTQGLTNGGTNGNTANGNGNATYYEGVTSH